MEPDCCRACVNFAGCEKRSSVHITFMPQEEAELAEAQGFLAAHGPAVPLGKCRPRDLR